MTSNPDISTLATPEAITKFGKLQSSVRTFLPGFGNVCLKYCVTVHFQGVERKVLRGILGTKQECFYTTLYPVDKED